jgi:hypothetical protein
MESKHTPGTWMFSDWVKAKGQGELPTKIIAAGRPYGREIAYLNFDTADPELSSDKVIANARLIASAPDMLEALQIALQQLAQGDDPTPEETAAWNTVNAAILKATQP